MSFFHTVFETDNAAFVESEPGEIVRILHKLADRIDNGAGLKGYVLDQNGNTVGDWGIKDNAALTVEEPRELFVLIVGDVANGFDFVGPFLGSDAAIEYGEEHIDDDTTWVHVPLHRGV